MLNLPSFSSLTVVALLVADLLILALLFVAAGPMFISGRDAFGRIVDGPSLLSRIMLSVMALLLAGYLGAQAVLVYDFMPYYLDPGATVTERVTQVSVVRDAKANPITYWITTSGHRFGVTPAIFVNIGVGDVVEARYRQLDDTLYEITVVRYANGRPGPGAAPAIVLPGVVPSSPAPRP